MSEMEWVVVLLGLLGGFVIVHRLFSEQKQDTQGADKCDGSEDYDRGADYEDDPHSTSRDGESSRDDSRDAVHRIFSCPACAQKIRLRTPLEGRLSRCRKCGNRFEVTMDDANNLYVHSRTSQYEDDELDSADVCLTQLGLGPMATSQEIKQAYRVRMKQYHPDKVAHLGEKLKAVSAREAQRLNSAYEFLKKMGYL